VLYVQVTVRLEEVKEREDQWHESLAHASVLRLKFYPLSFRRPEKYLLGRLSGYHSGEFRGNV
jgi:hypothetical protein